MHALFLPLWLLSATPTAPSAPPGFSSAGQPLSPSVPAPVVHAPATSDAPPPQSPSVHTPPSPDLTGQAWSLGLPAAVAIQHDGRIDGAVLISDIGLAVSTARTFVHATAPALATMSDGRSLPVRVLALDPTDDLALLQIQGAGPFPTVALGGALPGPGAPVLAIFQPGSLAWTPSPGVITQRWAPHAGHADTMRAIARVATPVLGEGGPVLDAQGNLLGIAAAPEQNQNPAEVNIITVDGLRSFLQRASAEAPTFALSIVTQPSGAEVLIDGKSAGHTGAQALVVSPLAMGRHELRLHLAGAADDVLSLELIRHQTEPLSRAMGPGGKLEIAANARAEVWIDGAQRGQVPLMVDLPAGRHVVDLRANGYLPVTQWVEVVAGMRAPLELSLERITAVLSMGSVPPGATVTANGEPLGTTPLAHVKVPAGQVELALQLAGKHSYRFMVALAPREQRDLGTYRLEDPYAWVDPLVPRGTQLSIDDGPQHVPQRYDRLPVGTHKLTYFAPDYYRYVQQVQASDGQAVELNPPLALYDHLAPRRALGYGLSGVGVALGLVSIGLATDDSSKNIAAPALAVAALALGTGAYCLVTSAGDGQAGWSEDRGQAPSAEAPK